MRDSMRQSARAHEGEYGGSKNCPDVFTYLINHGVVE